MNKCEWCLIYNRCRPTRMDKCIENDYEYFVPVSEYRPYKVCPLKKVGKDWQQEPTEKCDKDFCGLWDETHKQCSIVTIACK